jgi:hypothetical protein
MSQQNISSSGFEAVKVSVGFVRGLQGQVFKLEQIQQNLITQLDHANALVTEFHETSMLYMRKYDEVLHQMEEMKREHGYEKAILTYNLEAANEEAECQREQNQERSQQILLLERELTEQRNMTQTFQTFQTIQTIQTIQSQATTIAGMTDIEMDMDMDYHEELSPVSISSPTPRTPMTPRARTQTPTLEPETPMPETASPTAATTPSSFRFKFSPAMASCDGLYVPYGPSIRLN